MSTLKLALLQQPLVWLDAQANLRHFDMLLEPLRQYDVIVLPEMFTTGFAMNAAEDTLPEADIVTWLRYWSRQTDALIGGSVAVKTPSGAVNRFLLVEPSGKVHHYDKRHLFRMAGEHQSYAAGTVRTLVEWRGWRILPLICYDLRFPVWSRNQQDYDLALYVANWPSARAKVWQTLLAARAMENQAYVAGCNRVGHDDNGHHYQGDSLILDMQGEILAQAEPDQAAVLEAELSLEALKAYREIFPAWCDADKFLIV
ncbi:amidohydrolase [Yersinia massiliensis]|uniref:Omega-amidase YafV n=1 Tax=Yersinia massiliensis TaxID=419257 RepID=A0AA91B9Z3_9GAMM|nr:MULTISPECIES: amidohydrolase [Yersinia]HEC1651197.1 amidohydrolase [Yersinia enterocolitica]MDA5548167.1 amidohydrolase [Yersinia massiliensis]NIL25735.1 amidohydrolase [Yersinia massiliensis]OWF71355.1 amidohydrolase [Yersinia frederiksenii]PHZ21529.1 amidohydrolase [Yersinia massiliensis]